jgi:hypothetical protein
LRARLLNSKVSFASRVVNGVAVSKVAEPGSFCVFVASSDRAKDVFEIAFQNAETIWADCDWPRYVGFSTQHADIFGFTSISSRGPSDWRTEVGDQLDRLPAGVKYVMLILEDFFFTAPVDGATLNALADLVARDDLVYVRLEPIRRNISGRALEYLRRLFDRRPLRVLAFSEPYYSSVQVAIWRRDFLRGLLRQPGTIWEFENIVTAERHYAVWRPVVRYRDLVGRGKWQPDAARFLAMQGISLRNSTRPHQTPGFWLRRLRQYIIFQTIGYLSFRLRRRLNKLERS